MTRLTLLLTLGVLLALWVTNGVLYLTRMGLDPASVVTHYRGSEEQFVNPRTFGSMLEVTHAHLATMTVVVLLLTHLGVFLPLGNRTKATLVVVPFSTLLMGEASGWLTRFVATGFAVLKVICFLAFQISLLALMIALVRMLASPRSGNPAGGPLR